MYTVPQGTTFSVLLVPYIHSSYATVYTHKQFTLDSTLLSMTSW